MSEDVLRRLLGPPGHAVELPGWLDGWADTVERLAARIGARLDPVGLLTERAELLGHRGWGPTSAGGSARMMRAADGWMAVNLPRADDVADVPAWLAEPVGEDVWQSIAAALPAAPRDHWWERAGWLGLAAAPVGIAGTRPGVAVGAGDRPARARDAPVVVDLSALWAGPLCGALLATAGAEVTKVEALHRPDGARMGTPAFYARLNGAKRVLGVDLRSADGRAQLAELICAADVVIEASRPRALRRLGIDAGAEVARGAIWVSITGYGRALPGGDRVAFGDDAAAAGGLVTWPGGQDTPWFVGDAIADPLTGVVAARAALDQLDAASGALIDISMADVAAGLARGR